MGEYSFEHYLCLSKLLVSPRSHGQPSISKQQYSYPIKLFDGAFVKEVTLVDESDDKDILNQLYKDEEETKEATLNIKVKIEKYGKEFKIIQNMGYDGNGPIGKRKEGILEPINLPY